MSESSHASSQSHLSAEERAKQLIEAHRNCFTPVCPIEKEIADQIQQAMDSARAEGYTEGVALGPGMPFADQTSALLKEAYAEGQKEMRERAAKVVDENICSRLACDCCDSEKSVIKKIRAIPLSEGKEA